MATSIHVQGSALLTFGGSTLGYTDEGVEITFDYGLREIFTDNFGPFMPRDVLDTGKRATISGVLLEWDEAVLATAMSGAAASEGAIAAQGSLYLAGSDTGALIVGGTVAGEKQYTFPQAYLASVSRQVSTTETRVPFTFNAIWNGSGSLYTVATI